MGTQEEIYRYVKNLYGTKKVKQPEEKWPNDITRALQCLNENLFDQSFTVAKMREACNIPQKNFSSRFKHYVGYTPASYLKYHRIQCSIELIHHIEKDISISKLAFEIGYEYPSTFCSAFKSINGSSPKNYVIFSKKK
jgi:AraC-like DNA-binding protein